MGRTAWHSLVLCLLVPWVPVGRVVAQSNSGNLPAPVIAEGEQSSITQPDAQAPAPPMATQQRLDDAWWTGPLIANSPAALPKGHAYVESYLYDARSSGVDGFGSQTYVLYGLTDRLTIGMRPLFGYTRIDGGGSSSRIGVGDLTLHAQYALTTYSPGQRMPAIAIAIEQSLPIGRYDHLDKQSDGFGNGAHTATVGVYAQQVFWLGNGRILRGRLNVSGSFSSRTKVRNLSAYGTSDGFDGDVRPGASVVIDNSWEYSLTRHWVLAIDFNYRHDAPTSLHDKTGTRANQSGESALDTFAVAPAIEYNWSARVGVIFGARIIANRGNSLNSLTPVMALSVLM